MGHDSCADAVAAAHVDGEPEPDDATADGVEAGDAHVVDAVVEVGGCTTDIWARTDAMVVHWARSDRVWPLRVQPVGHVSKSAREHCDSNYGYDCERVWCACCWTAESADERTSSLYSHHVPEAVHHGTDAWAGH